MWLCATTWQIELMPVFQKFCCTLIWIKISPEKVTINIRIGWFNSAKFSEWNKRFLTTLEFMQKVKHDFSSIPWPCTNSPAPWSYCFIIQKIEQMDIMLFNAQKKFQKNWADFNGLVLWVSNVTMVSKVMPVHCIWQRAIQCNMWPIQCTHCPVSREATSEWLS